MTAKKFEELKQNIIAELRSHLLPGLYYHSVDHTLDVMEAAERIGAAEKITEQELVLLKTAALLHDSGYLFTAKNHEENSCRIAQYILPKYEVPENDINAVCELIMATKIPHNPHNKLAEIICDADLDYLGRNDFYTLSKNLFMELKLFDKVSDENIWNQMQVVFLERHKYFTSTANSSRAAMKEKHLNSIRESVRS